MKYLHSDFYENKNRALPIKSFCYYTTKNKRNVRVMLLSYCPINDSYDPIDTFVYLPVMLQSYWSTAEGN